MIVLIGVGLYSIWLNLDKVGGLVAWLERSKGMASRSPLTGLEAIDLVVRSLGAVASGSPDFTAYLGSLGGWVGPFALVGVTVALWTTGDTNLYLPSVRTASLCRQPKRVTVRVCGLLASMLIDVLLRPLERAWQASSSLAR